MTREQQMRDQYVSLMQRVNEIGAQIPRPEDVDLDDEQAVAGVMLLLKEFNKANDKLMRLTKKINALPSEG